MKDRILLVDDERNILNSYQRNLRKIFHFDVAISGAEALEMMAANKPYALIISDMQMPQMNGIELLSKVKEKYPETVRMMLTGNSDQQTAIEAVNVSDIFKFLNKPCSTEQLIEAIKAGLKQYHLIMSEKILLNNTLKGVINVLNEVLNLVNPDSMSHNTQLRHYMFKLAAELKLSIPWSFEPMIQLSQLGCVIFPPDTIKNMNTGQALTPEQRQLFEQHPCLSSDLIRKIPRMEKIANTILYQEKNFDGTGIPIDEVKGVEIPYFSRMLKVVLDFIRFEGALGGAGQALMKMNRYSERYDPNILQAFINTITVDLENCPREITIPFSDLTEKMTLKGDIRTNRGQLVARKGQEITEPLYRIILHCLDNGALNRLDLIGVRLPDEEEDKPAEGEEAQES